MEDGVFGALVTAYLFLGGLGGGMVLVFAACELRAWAKPSAGDFFAVGRLRNPILGIAAAALALGSLCLFADLARPDSAYLLITRITLSPISLGALSLMGLLACIAILLCLGGTSLRGRLVLPARISTAALAVALAAFVVTYTGILLNVVGASPVWKSPLLVVLFVASSVSAGGAMVLLAVAVANRGPYVPAALERFLGVVDGVVGVAELAAVVALILSVAKDAGFVVFLESLWDDPLFPCSVVAYALFGIAGPLFLAWRSTRRTGLRSQDAVLVAALVMLGSLCLRCGVMMTGSYAFGL